jgi:hypothetical protein
MAILGTPTSVVVFVAIAVFLSFALPIIYALKFDWDPANIEAAMGGEE